MDTERDVTLEIRTAAKLADLEWSYQEARAGAMFKLQQSLNSLEGHMDTRSNNYFHIKAALEKIANDKTNNAAILQMIAKVALADVAASDLKEYGARK